MIPGVVGTTILLLLLGVAAVTDVRQRKILNWTTYPGILIALTGSALATWLPDADATGTARSDEVWGFVSCSDSVAGFLACGIAMLICYVFFPGGVGGGDVKLIAMVGAFLGLYSGLEAMLWTFVLGGCQAVIFLIWRHGAWQLARRAAVALWFFIRSGGQLAPASAEEPPAFANMFLSPSALVAVMIVQFRIGEWLRW